MFDKSVYRGNPLSLCFPDGKIRDCIPSIYRNRDDGSLYALIADVKGGDFIIIDSPRPILTYRTIEMIRLLGKIENISLCVICLIEGGVPNHLREEVNEEKFQIALKAPIPREIIDVILTEGHDVEIDDLQTEIYRGNIPWQPEFVKVGIEDPAEESRKVIERLDSLLKGYQGFLMITDESLIKAIQEECVRIDRVSKIPDTLIVAVAGVTAFFKQEIASKPLPEQFAETTVQDAFLEDSAAWLTERTSWSVNDCALIITAKVLEFS